MGNSSELDKATERLDAALRSIEDAVAGRRKRELKNETLVERIQSLETSVESERSMNEKLNSTNKEVTGRIDTVIASLDDMLRNS